MNNSESIITIIIVLFKKKISESISYIKLSEYLTNSSLKYNLIIYNNSPEITIEPIDEITIINSNKNGKLPEAYNFALNTAIQNNSKWLLLLDQDTEITNEYIIELEKTINTINGNKIVAIVPKLVDNETLLSPKTISKFGWWENDIKNNGVQSGRVVAFNSLSLLKVDFLKNLGGFSKKYPLDMLDHWYYNQIYLQKKKVYVLDSFIQHSLSFQNYENEVSITRHIDFLNAEFLFLKELGLAHFISYKIKLTLRAIKQYIIFNNKKYSKLTFKKIFSF